MVNAATADGVGQIAGMSSNPSCRPRVEAARHPHHPRAGPLRSAAAVSAPIPRDAPVTSARPPVEGTHSSPCPRAPAAGTRRASCESSRKIPRSALVTVREFCFSHAAHHHAEVGGLDHHADARRLQHVHDRVGDLLGEPLLHLQPAREHVDDARELGEARRSCRRGCRRRAPGRRTAACGARTASRARCRAP